MKRKSTAKAILSNIHALEERRYKGDTAASDTLIDFLKAVNIANLTDRQSEAIRLRYDEDLTQVKTAELMEVTQQAVELYERTAIKKIDEVYEMWAWMDGELSPTDFEREAN